MNGSVPSAPPPDSTPRPVPPVQGLAPGTIADWLRWAEGELQPASDSARPDAEVLLAALLGVERSQLVPRHADPIEAATVLRLAGWIERRKLGEPVAYLVGRQGFWTLDLAVDTAVLIPRPDTETLVEWALGVLDAAFPRGRSPGSDAPRVLDLGTGSGAIALAIASERPDAVIVATDVSQTALDVARENARRNDLTVVDFRHGRWFDAVAADAGAFDLIVSNPPYIAESDAHLADLKYEPRLALTSGRDGLKAIREIVGCAVRYLSAGGWLLLEHGHDQAPSVRTLLQEASFIGIETRRDFGGNDRVTGARRP